MSTDFDNEDVNFDINVTCRRYQVPRLIALLKYIEYCGKIGHGACDMVFIDGDGAVRPQFKFSVEPGSDQEYKPITVNCGLVSRKDPSDPDKQFYVDNYWSLG